MDEALNIVIERLNQLSTAMKSRARRLDQDFRANNLFAQSQSGFSDEQNYLYDARNELWDVNNFIVAEARDQLIAARDKGLMHGDIDDIVAKVERGEIRH